MLLELGHRRPKELPGELTFVIRPRYKRRTHYKFLIGERPHRQAVPRNAPCTGLRKEGHSLVTVDERDRLFRGRDMMDLPGSDSKLVGSPSHLIIERGMDLSSKQYPDSVMTGCK